MLRRRHPPLALALGAGALVAMLAGAPPAAAQDANDSSLLNPAFSGNPQNPPRFRRSGSARDPTTAQAKTFGNAPGFGAGTTGFDSTNARKKKGKGGAKNGAKAKGAVSTFGVAPARSTANLPAAAARLPQNQTRRGASPYPAAEVVGTVTPDAPPRRRLPPPDPAPFDPVGIQVGAFLFKPAIELTGGYDTNPARTQNATPSWYSVIAPELLFNSNWARHEFKGELRGTYSAYKELPTENRPSFDGKLTGRVDITRDTRIDLESRFLVGTDNPGSPNIQAGLVRLPIFTTWGGTAGLGHRFNRFDIAVKAGAERTVYQDSKFTDGTTASNDTRDYNRYLSTLRGTYELTPGLKPFVEIGADQRVHDIPIDVNGFRRDSDGAYIKGGTTFELTRILTGEAAVGWLARRYKDPTLPNIGGLTFDGSLVWVASALTTAKLTARTQVDESTVPGVSGVFTREVAIQVDHAFRRWLVATLKFTRGLDDYVGSPREDDRYAISAGIVYKLTRELHLKSEVQRVWLRSNIPEAGYNATIGLIGLRLQR
ncbi:MAG: outer membrane beta-barrel protein [Xanthobacteraceae bacterium]